MVFKIVIYTMIIFVIALFWCSLGAWAFLGMAWILGLAAMLDKWENEEE